MTWWQRLRAKRVAKRALALLRTGRDTEAWSLLSTAGPPQAQALRLVAARLAAEGRTAHARRAIEESLRIGGDEPSALMLLAQIEVESERLEEAEALYRRALALSPGDMTCSHDLALVLLHQERPAEAIALLRPIRRDVGMTFVLAKALVEEGEHDEARVLLDDLLRHLELKMKSTCLHSEFRGLQDEHREVRDLRDAIVRDEEGSEGLVVAGLVAGRLKARSSINHQLIGQALMTRAPSWAPDTTLRSVEDSAAHGFRLAEAGDPSRGRCHVGCSALRAGRIEKAMEEFERARDLNGANFAATLGLGAAMRWNEARMDRLLARLPEPSEIPELERLVPDAPQLTTNELRVVQAAVRPFAAALAQLRRRGAMIRVLPIDARLVDLPEFAALAGERDEHQRCVEGLTGCKVDRFAACKIESLLDVSESGWTFAHELAHLAHDALPPAWQLRILRMFLRARDVGWAGTAYQLSNEHEWFAVSYTDYLATRHGLPIDTMPDDEGVMQAALGMFDELAACATFGEWTTPAPSNGE